MAKIIIASSNDLILAIIMTSHRQQGFRDFKFGIRGRRRKDTRAAGSDRNTLRGEPASV